MKNLVLAALFCILLATFTPVYASNNVEVIINDNFQVSFDFGNINATTYSEIKAHPEIFNSTSIPSTIVKNLDKQNLKQVSWSQASTDIFNDNEKSIHVEFSLGGEDILSYTLNTATQSRTCSVKTAWMQFDIKLTSTFVLNFSTYFATSISNWQRVNSTAEGIVHPAFFRNSTAGMPSSYAVCYFILPATATNIQATGTILTFDTPLVFEDRLLNSPILILAAVIVANIFFIIYRKVKK